MSAGVCGLLALIVLAVWVAARPLALAGIGVYRRLAPARVRESCRFHPTCSVYAELAIRERGALVGGALTLGRLSRCRPPNGGVDWPGRPG